MSEFVTFEVESSRQESVSLTVARRAALVTAIGAFLNEAAARGPIPQGANLRLPEVGAALPRSKGRPLGQSVTAALAAAETPRGATGRGLRECGTAIRDAKRLVATVKALDQLALRSLGDSARGELSEVAPVLQVVQRALETSDHAALGARGPEIGAALGKLSGRLRETHNRLAVRERRATAELVGRAMRDIGLATVRVQEREGRQGETTTVLRAEHQGISVYAKVSSAGTIKIDTAGFHGRECRKAVERLAVRMEELGLSVRRRASVSHGADGGELVEEIKPLFDPIATPRGSVCAATERFEQQRQRALAVAQQALRNSVHRGGGR